VLGQEIPAGALVTVPLPVGLTVRTAGTAVKLAETIVSAARVIWQLPVPLHPPPLHPAKLNPGAGVDANVTCVPTGKGAAQVVGQVMPAGALVTVPPPPFVTVSVAVAVVP